jgi:hypothetical protein
MYLSPFITRSVCLFPLILLDLITFTLFGEEYKLRNSYLCSFLHSPVTSSHLGPNMLSTPHSETDSVCVTFGLLASVAINILLTQYDTGILLYVDGHFGETSPKMSMNVAPKFLSTHITGVLNFHPQAM